VREGDACLVCMMIYWIFELESAFLRFHRSFLAFCLGVTGFTNPPDRSGLATMASSSNVGAFADPDTLKSGRRFITGNRIQAKVAVQMGFATMLNRTPINATR